MKNIAIIPARSGSKGLKNKNIKLLNGVPLIAYSIDAAKESKLFYEVMVSTDSDLYADIAKKYGASVPFLRSEAQSNDTADSWDAVKEVLNKYMQLGETFDTVCLLQPTSPLRNAKDIISAYNLYYEKKADSITSVCEVDHSPLWSMILPLDNSLEEFRKNFKEVPRQQLAKYYRINGAVYIRKVEYTKDNVIIKDTNEYAFVMNRRRSIDIDTIEDFELAEFYIKNNLSIHDLKSQEIKY